MDNIIAYFKGEQLQCFVGAVCAIVIIAVSIFFLFQEKALLKGMAYVAILLSAFLLIICLGVIFRTSKDINRVTTFYQETPESIQSVEIPRMEKVMNSFSVIKKVELVICILGLLLSVIFWRNEMIRGVAIGLIVMGISLYVFDHVAESRGDIYIQFLKSLSFKE